MDLIKHKTNTFDEMSDEAFLLPPNIYTYLDFRFFLNDYFNYLKINKKLTKREVAARAGISESYMSMILNGKRSATSEQLKQVIQVLRIDRSEASYLLLLNKLSREKDLREQAKVIENLRRFHDYQQQNPLEVASAKYLSKWFHVAIRELSFKEDFILDTQWIRENLHFPLTTQELDHALQFLTENGFIEIGRNGKVVLQETTIECREEALKPSLAEFHSQMLQLAIRAISLMSSEERQITGYTKLISKSTALEAKKILRETEEKLMKLFAQSEEPGDQVYHFSFLAIPLTKNKNKEVK